MRHKYYYEIKAKNHFDLGLALGGLFGDRLRQSIAQSRKTVSKNRVDQAEKCLAVTRKYLPQYLQELEGYAKAAQVKFFDLWLRSLEDELDHLDKCTFIATNNGKLFSHNEDWKKGSGDYVCLLKKTIGKLTIWEVFYYNTLGGCSVSINSYGFTQSINTLASSDNQLGVPRNVIARWLSETRNPEKNFQKLKTFPRASGYNHNIVSRRGEVWNIECTARKQIMNRPELPFVHTNHYLQLSLLDLEENDNSTGSRKRFELASQKVKPTMKTAELIRLAGDVSDGKTASVFNERTIARVVVDLENNSVKAWLLREKERGWIEYPLNFFNS